MAVTTIMPETTLAFVYSEIFGLYNAWVDPLFELKPGAIYTVVWDKDVHTLTAVAMNMGDLSGVCVGNLALLGLGEDTEENFILGSIDNDGGSIFITTEEDSTNTITIHEGVIDNPSEPERQDGIILRDYKGEEATYGDIERIMVDKTGGGVVEYIREDLVQENTGSDGAFGIWEPEWIDDVCFWDYDGTLIAHMSVNDVKRLSELPTTPEHAGLIFAGWNYTLEELHAIEYPRDVGAIYRTADGHTHAIINVKDSSYRAMPIYFGQTVSNGVTIDWGDGTTSTVSGTGYVTTTHTYSTTGKYEIVLKVSSGCVLTLGYTTSNYYAVIGGNASAYRNYLEELYIGNSVKLDKYMIYNCCYLTLLTISPGFTVIPEYCIYGNYRVRAVIIPIGVTTIGKYNIYYIGSYNVENQTIISIPETVETIGANSLYSITDVKRVVIPSKVTEINTYVCGDLPNAVRIFMSDTVTSILGIGGCRTLHKFKLPSELVETGYCFLGDSSITECIMPSKLTKLGDYTLRYTALRRLIIKGEITSIGSYTLNSARVSELIICSQTNVNDAIKGIVSSSGYYRHVYVPDEAVETYRTTVSRDYKERIYPLSEYKGVIP